MLHDLTFLKALRTAIMDRLDRRDVLCTISLNLWTHKPQLVFTMVRDNDLNANVLTACPDGSKLYVDMPHVNCPVEMVDLSDPNVDVVELVVGQLLVAINYFLRLRA